MKRKVLRFLAKNMNASCSSIAESLKVTPAILTPVLQQMRTDKLVKSSGNTRGTRWTLLA